MNVLHLQNENPTEYLSTCNVSALDEEVSQCILCISKLRSISCSTLMSVHCL